MLLDSGAGQDGPPSMKSARRGRCVCCCRCCLCGRACMAGPRWGQGPWWSGGWWKKARVLLWPRLHSEASTLGRGRCRYLRSGSGWCLSAGAQPSWFAGSLLCWWTLVPACLSAAAPPGLVVPQGGGGWRRWDGKMPEGGKQYGHILIGIFNLTVLNRGVLLIIT